MKKTSFTALLNTTVLSTSLIATSLMATPSCEEPHEQRALQRTPLKVRTLLQARGLDNINGQISALRELSKAKRNPRLSKKARVRAHWHEMALRGSSHLTIFKKRGSSVAGIVFDDQTGISLDEQSYVSYMLKITKGRNLPWRQQRQEEMNLSQLSSKASVVSGKYLSLQFAAKNGDPQAQFELSKRYDEKDNTKKRLFWLKKAAEQEHSAAQYQLGMYYFYETDDEADEALGLSLIKKAAEQEYKEAQYQLGCYYFYEMAGEPDEALGLPLIKKAAEQGYITAQYNLGLLYDEGEEVEYDTVEAVYWYKKAAEQGHKEAQYKLGLYYLNGDFLEAECFEAGYFEGENVERDPVEAVYWFKKAAEQGDKEAAYKLGVFYAEGEGVEKDPVEAVYWFKKAAEQGHAKAQYKLGLFYLGGEIVERNPVEAVSWFEKAAEQGYAPAQYQLGLFYLEGTVVEQNSARAFSWFEKAAEQGYAPAQYQLGLFYYYGIGVEKDLGEAIHLFRNAAAQGHKEAKYELGVIYYYGIGVEKDEALGISLFKKAAEQGYAKAQYQLGSHYSSGRGVKKNRWTALYWYIKSAQSKGEEARNDLRQQIRYIAPTAEEPVAPAPQINADELRRVTYSLGLENAVNVSRDAMTQIHKAYFLEKAKFFASWETLLVDKKAFDRLGFMIPTSKVMITHPWQNPMWRGRELISAQDRITPHSIAVFYNSPSDVPHIGSIQIGSETFVCIGQENVMRAQELCLRLRDLKELSDSNSMIELKINSPSDDPRNNQMRDDEDSLEESLTISSYAKKLYEDIMRELGNRAAHRAYRFWQSLFN